MDNGGHAASEETPVETVIKELTEESGIYAETEQSESIIVYPHRDVRKIKWIFSLEVGSEDIELKLEQEEIKETKWVENEQLEHVYRSSDKKWTNKGFELITFDLLKKVHKSMPR